MPPVRPVMADRPICFRRVLEWQRCQEIAKSHASDASNAFSRGAEFEDKYNLLRGVGKVSKHVKIKNPADANKEVLRYYIKQALEFDVK